MKLTTTILRRPATVAGLLLAMSAPATVFSAGPYGTPVRPTSQVQPVAFNCPNGDCNSYGGGGLFGHGCRHGSASGVGWVRPPATYGLSRTPNTYRYYWNSQLAGVPSQGGQQYPMIYHPTDTTQMGFYYQSVPRWQYRPEMLPPAPAPYWPMGFNSGYGTYGAGASYQGGGVVTNPTYAPTTAQPAVVTPAAPNDPQVPAIAPPPPAEPDVNVPEPEAAVFPNRRRF